MNYQVVWLLVLVIVAVSGRRPGPGRRQGSGHRRPRMGRSGALDDICDGDSDCLEAGRTCLEALEPDNIFQIQDLDDFNDCLSENGIDEIDTSSGNGRQRKLIDDTLEGLSDEEASLVKCCYWDKAGLLRDNNKVRKNLVRNLLGDAIDDDTIFDAFNSGIDSCQRSDCDVEAYGDCLLEACITALQ